MKSLVEFTVGYFKKGEFVSYFENYLWNGQTEWGIIPDGEEVTQKRDIWDMKGYRSQEDLRGVILPEDNFAIVEYKIVGVGRIMGGMSGLEAEQSAIGNEIFEEWNEDILKIASELPPPENNMWNTFLTLWDVTYHDTSTCESVYPEYDAVIRMIKEVKDIL